MRVSQRELSGIALCACVLVAIAYWAIHLYTPTESVEVSVGTAEIDQARKVLARTLAGDTTGWSALTVDSAAAVLLINKRHSPGLPMCMQRAPAALSFHLADTATVSWSPRATQLACGWLARVNVTLVGVPGDAHLVRISVPRPTIAAGDCVPSDGDRSVASGLRDVRCAAPAPSLDERLLSTSEREWTGLSLEAADRTTQTVAAAFVGRGAVALDCAVTTTAAPEKRQVRGLWRYQEYAVELTEASEGSDPHSLRLTIKPMPVFRCDPASIGRP